MSMYVAGRGKPTHTGHRCTSCIHALVRCKVVQPCWCSHSSFRQALWFQGWQGSLHSLHSLHCAPLQCMRSITWERQAHTWRLTALDLPPSCVCHAHVTCNSAELADAARAASAHHLCGVWQFICLLPVLLAVLPAVCLLQVMDTQGVCAY